MTTSSNFAHGPGGLRQTENHHDLSVDGLAHLDSDGRLFKMVDGQLEEIVEDGPPIVEDPPSDQATGPGWVTFASWTPATDVTTLEATWEVPEPPANNKAQILFLHIGLQGKSKDTVVMAPVVLQWGRTLFGGGDGWTVACWLQIGENIMVGNYVDVAAGDTIEAHIAHTHSGAKDLWKMKAKGGGETASLAFTLEASLTEQIAYGGSLEAYALDMKCDQYPASPKLSFGSIQLGTADGPIKPEWKAQDEITNCGQHTQVVDPATVDVYFRS
ncbi:MAG: G1 family glutamic endopeptidase [Acidobacteriota bacterium]